LDRSVRQPHVIEAAAKLIELAGTGDAFDYVPIREHRVRAYQEARSYRVVAELYATDATLHLQQLLYPNAHIELRQVRSHIPLKPRSDCVRWCFRLRYSSALRGNGHM
jgi:hypothetical protein